MIRGENCIDASVSVINRMAKTIETTVIMEAPMPPRITCATWGSACDGKITLGIHALTSGVVSSSHENRAPAEPNVTAIASGRIRNPPRRLYSACRNRSETLLFTSMSLQL